MKENNPGSWKVRKREGFGKNFEAGLFGGKSSLQGKSDLIDAAFITLDDIYTQRPYMIGAVRVSRPVRIE